MVVASTTKTSWTSATDSTFGQRLATYSVTADELLDENPNWKLWRQEHYSEQDSYQLYVIALDKDYNSSSLSAKFSSDDIAYKMPLHLAFNTLGAQAGKSWSVAKTIDDIPSVLPVTMGDGSTRNFVMSLDADNARVVENGGTSGKRRLYIPYSLNGTSIAKEVLVNEVPDDWKQAIADKDAQIQSLNATGALDTDSIIEPNDDFEIDKKSYSDSVSETKIRISASSPLEEYLGANMAAGKSYLDLSAFPEAADSTTLKKAVNSVKDKNPVLPGSSITTTQRTSSCSRLCMQTTDLPPKSRIGWWIRS